MRPYGTDRVRTLPDGRVVLLSRDAKRWTAPAGKAPGTAVRWDDRYFEVVAAVSSAAGVRYELEPWRDDVVMRVVEPYDEASEAALEADRRDAASRNAKRRWVKLAALATGHFPAPVQQHYAREYGVDATRLTVFSTITAPVCLTIALGMSVGAFIEERPGLVPGWLIFLLLLMTFDSLIRFMLVSLLARPVGSVPGFVAYSIYYLVARDRRKLVAPLGGEAGWRTIRTEAPPELALDDAYRVCEPFLTLLSEEEQEALTRRFGFDHRRHGTLVASIVMAFSAAGVLTSLRTLALGPSLSALCALVLAAALAGEQALRIVAMRRGPRRSMLAPLVRLFARRVLAAGEA